ncbi:hypothetical protein BMS3Bbin01_00431 [bacterium BMS3Bbin01]|nr:hypothetical protein BMS3Bbin01_00431 [bacterium BMS3Bbin01]
MRSRLKKRLRPEPSDSGAALVWAAGSLVALLAFSALMVDLAWIYLNASRLQNAADAAALAGVVDVPGFMTLAQSDAEDAAAANSFPVGGGLNGNNTVAIALQNDDSLQVTLHTEVRTFFLRAIGFSQFDITRASTAEYIKPVALGSPDNQFGGPSQDFWAAINGRYTDRHQGDPYATSCIDDNTTTTCDSTNPWYRDPAMGTGSGYYYAVEIAPGATGLQVQFYDPGHYLRSGGRSGGSETGDTSWLWPSSPNRGVNVKANLFKPDTTPGDPTDNTDLACTKTWGTYVAPLSSSDRQAGGYERWVDLCLSAIPNPIPGVWVLQLPSPLWEGSTKFAMRATTSSADTPKLYGINDMSIHVNKASGTPRPWLAEIIPEHAGKTLQVDIWDIGESNTMTLKILDPDNNVVDCTWTATNGESDTSLGACTINVGGRRFNAEWLYLTIPIPDDYTCDPDQTYDCWWKVDISNMSNPTDRTTWSARVVGNPLQLIPNP